MKFRTILAVDWSKGHKKRVACVADVGMRTVDRLSGGPWTLECLLGAARRLPGPVLVCIDAVLGVPSAYFERARDVAAWKGVAGFLDWLPRALALAEFANETMSPEGWRPERPFICVPPGKGSLRAFWSVTGGPLLREVERTTQGKSAFVVSGVPGTVGSGTRALWCELAPCLPDRDFGIWPFDGAQGDLAERHHVVLAEIYPRVCYGLALATGLPASPLDIAKTDPAARAEFLDQFAEHSWLSTVHVAFDALDTARRHEDDFDALLSARSFDAWSRTARWRATRRGTVPFRGRSSASI